VAHTACCFILRHWLRPASLPDSNWLPLH